MRIAIFGCGNMGRTLGASWAIAGNHILFASSKPEKARYLAEHFPENAEAASYDQAADAEIVLYTANCAPERLLGDPLKVRGLVLDCRNRPLNRGGGNGADQPLFNQTATTTLAESLQAQLPMARVVKALNLHAQEIFENTPEELRALKVTSFYCGEADRQTTTLLEQLGLEPLHIGALQRAHHLEAMGQFWLSLTLEQRLGMTGCLVWREIPEKTSERFGGRMPSYREEPSG